MKIRMTKHWLVIGSIGLIVFILVAKIFSKPSLEKFVRQAAISMTKGHSSFFKENLSSQERSNYSDNDVDRIFNEVINPQLKRYRMTRLISSSQEYVDGLAFCEVELQDSGGRSVRIVLSAVERDGYEINLTGQIVMQIIGIDLQSQIEEALDRNGAENSNAMSVRLAQAAGLLRQHRFISSLPGSGLQLGKTASQPVHVDRIISSSIAVVMEKTNLSAQEIKAIIRDLEIDLANFPSEPTLMPLRTLEEKA